MLLRVRRLAVVLSAFPLMNFGCSQQPPKNNGSGPHVSEPNTGAPNEEDNDENDEIALEPVEVSGAFLTGIYPDTSAPAKDGKTAFAVKVLVASTGKAVTDPVEINAITYSDNGAPITLSPESVQNSGKTAAVFYLPQDWDHASAAAEVTLSVNESSSFSVATQLLASGDSALPDTAVNANAPLPLTNVEQHQLFVTNGRYKPSVDFKDVRTANALCNKEAQSEADLKTLWWKAVLAAPGQSISQRIPLYGAVQNLLGEQLAAAGQSLAGATFPDGSLQFANFGTAGLGSNNAVLTGSKKDGAIGDTCGGWASNSGTAHAGNPASGANWLSASNVNCGQAWRLYCISSKKKMND